MTDDEQHLFLLLRWYCNRLRLRVLQLIGPVRAQPGGEITFMQVQVAVGAQQARGRGKTGGVPAGVNSVGVDEE